MQQITRKIIPPTPSFFLLIFLDPDFKSFCSVSVYQRGHPDIVLHTDVHVAGNRVLLSFICAKEKFSVSNQELPRVLYLV